MGPFDSGSIADLTVPNRGLYRPVRTRLGEDGQPTEALGAHLAARASGGAGGIVGPADMLVHPSASGPSYLDAHRSDNVERFAEITEAVHDEGSVIIGQLTHPGSEETGDWEMQEQLGPSSSPSDAAYEMPKPMTTEEIRAVQQGFVESAENLVAAGFDGVELAANPFSVLRQFLSPRFNTRDDEYGGDWADRARFLNETLDRVGNAVDVPVGVHLSLSELVYGGYQFEDAPDLVGAIEGYDYLSCTLGTRSTFNQTHAGFADGEEPLVDAIETVADEVDTPVMGRAQFTTVEDADRLFDAGADFVSFTRQLVADPETLTAVEDDESYHRCIECNQKCLEGIYAHAHGGHIECVVNPRVGREQELPPLSDAEPAAIEQDVLVVGGGPAGLRFAAIAADRGHDVTLREAADELGGQLRTAATGMFEPFGRATEDLIRDVEASTVTVETGTEVTAEGVSSEWDVVIVATGATRPELPKTEGEVVDAFDVLDGTEVGEDVLLYDDNRWVLTHQTANRLLAQDVDLEIVTRDHYPGFRTEQANLPGLVAALQAQGATFTGNHALDGVADDGTVTLRNTLTGETDTRTPDDVVYVGRRGAAESLYTELKTEVVDLYRIGDAVSPRKLDRAYYDGEMLARRL
ncbi:MAG: 2,4-dienoyl-CoA reductase-like NADH-dependent reductase (Old Yellow Enzyme family) [Haloarculaceae archaeon]|jgi:2,4-dienoyl-CoA reductase-like NADH-dependent reductase (Old Yellow Enzyme family)/thioredoxin reductase